MNRIENKAKCREINQIVSEKWLVLYLRYTEILIFIKSSIHDEVKLPRNQSNCCPNKRGDEKQIDRTDMMGEMNAEWFRQYALKTERKRRCDVVIKSPHKQTINHSTFSLKISKY